MTDTPRRRKGQTAAGVRARSGPPAEAHSGTPADFLRRHGLEARAASRDPRLRANFCAKLLGRVADIRNLKLSIDHVSRGCDPALALDSEERWDLARVLGRALRNGSYRPGPGRTQRRAKSSGRGFRTLTVPDFVDRVVERALVQVLSPFLDPLSLETSLGFRPGRGRNHALALAESVAVNQGRRVLAAEDLKDAFDHVPLGRLKGVLAHVISDESVVRLAMVVASSGPGNGLKQGGPLSPLLLNLYLHHMVDRRWQSLCPDCTLIRVADDLLVLSDSAQGVEEARGGLSDLVRACGMSLKDSPVSTTRDLLTRESVVWLGFEVGYADGRLQFDLTERSWKSLSQKLMECHEYPDSPTRAVGVVRGWVGQMGPAYSPDKAPQVYLRLTHVASDSAFDELPSQREFARWWAESHDRWDSVRAGSDTIRGVPRGSARAEAHRADSGPPPAGPPERGGAAGTSSPPTYRITTAAECPEPGGPGAWGYRVERGDHSPALVREGTSARTTLGRMQRLALLRALETVPAGSRVELPAPPADATAGGTGTADLDARLASEFARREIAFLD